MASQRSATIVMPGEGETYHAVGDRYRFLATREVTDGKYGIWEAIVPPGSGPPPHLHTREEEGFYVVEGEVVLYVDGRRVVAEAGAFVNMPVGSTHCFRNESDRPAKLLILVAPGGFEAMFRKTGTPVSDPSGPIPRPTEAEIQTLLATVPEFGIEIKLPDGSTSDH